MDRQRGDELMRSKKNEVSKERWRRKEAGKAEKNSKPERKIKVRNLMRKNKMLKLNYDMSTSSLPVASNLKPKLFIN